MILALIMATLNQLPDPEQRPVMTPLALKLFPGNHLKTERNRAALRQPSPIVPSLKQTMIHYIRTHPDSLEAHWQEKLENKLGQRERPELFEQVMKNTPFYHDRATIDKRSKLRKLRRRYLTSASLVVVPNNLLQQWRHEATKHCEPSVRLLAVASNQVLPSAKSLASGYDVSASQSLHYSEYQLSSLVKVVVMTLSST